MKKQILIIDDEQPILEIMKDILEDEGYAVFTAPDGIDGLNVLKTEPIDLVFLDVWMPRMGGIEVLENIKKDYQETEVIIISGHANVDLAVKAIKMGAYDFIEKPLDIDRILNLANNALELQNLKKENRKLKQVLFPVDEIIGTAPSILKIKTLIEQTAPTDSRVMILGGNGTGKELVARQIHAKSKRAGKPFIEVNCAAIPDTLIESELFGHEKGSFTGAIGRRIGRFEAADGGTLFMDEIADMSLQAQAKVLRAVQEMKFERVGGRESIHVDVRIISATNKDIQKEIQEGRFREDLFFRLNVIPINIPSLTERSGDIPALLDYFINFFSEKHNTGIKKLSDESLKMLKEYSWPGNIRELKNFTERISIMCSGETLAPEDITPYLNNDDFDSADTLISSDFNGLKLQDARDLFEKNLLIAKLEENDYNISKTAEALGIYPSNLHNKIRKFGIETKK